MLGVGSSMALRGFLCRAGQREGPSFMVGAWHSCGTYKDVYSPL
jgi:hypothetical protein